ncbi:VWA domain-containing protein [Planomicrobium sp. Y74]|uniref:VWA domain-containing protein n=1 Tax=Planomicrobium sp. Y74 TaxID=2478977 RepID=UPI000EF528AC|nr:VWA domain-containing protein [Planomicrobium sp. Y74]RLQ92912.1 VWA domain-containing protein [Planomicrobium sp. Y74]
MELRIDEPLWLLLVIPAAIYLFMTGWKQYNKASSLFRTSFVLRLLSIFFLIVALASPAIHQPIEEEQIVFLWDRSASMAQAGNGIAEQLNQVLAEKENHQRVGVYTFAEDFQSLLPLSSDTAELPGDRPVSEQDHTDIAQALELAANSGEQELATRVILLSDGNETTASALESLARIDVERVTIDVFPIEAPSGNETALTEFQTPAQAFSGEELNFSMIIEADLQSEGELILSANDAEIERIPVNLEEGRNILSYSYEAQSEGLLKFEASIEIEGDEFLQNNQLTSLTEVEGPPELLIVSSEGASPITGLLDNENLNLEEISPSGVPQNLSSILAYDGIIFDNVPGTQVGEQTMAVIEQAVKEFGMGFMMVGGDQSFGLGGYFKTPIENLLPVEMEVKGKHELPSLGLVIVMDRSGSMAGQKMELAKEAAARSVELLREDDVVGVIAFDDKPWQIVPTEKLEDRQQAIDDILTVSPGGGTEIYSSLAEAYGQLEELDLQRKHIILLTDGQSATQNDYASLIDGGVENNITLSTVAVGQDADRALLESLAETGSGRFYDVTDATTIPAILSRETVMMSRTYIVDEPFYPIIYDSAWSPLFGDGVPQLNSYIATTAKDTARVVAESEQEDPVLAEWNYGLGKTVAFTSGSGAWSGDFQSWSNWPAFWNRSVSQILPSFTEAPFSVSRKQQGLYTIEDPSQSSAILNVTVINEAGEEIPVQTEPVAPGVIDVHMEEEPGLVFFSVSNESGAAYRTGLTIPYGEEYRSEPADMELLTTIAERSGGQVLDNLEDAFRDIPYSSSSTQTITIPLILLAMLLFFADITIRRFGLRLPAMPKRTAAQPQTDNNEGIEQLLKAKQRNKK